MILAGVGVDAPGIFQKNPAASKIGSSRSGATPLSSHLVGRAVIPTTLCLLLAFAAAPETESGSSLYEFSPKLAASIRGQSPSGPYPPLSGPVLGDPVPYAANGYDPFQPQPPMTQDPFYNYGDPALMNPAPMPAPMFSGVNGPQPYRFGLIPRVDVGYIPESDIRDVNSGVEMFEFDSELRKNSPFGLGWVCSTAAQFNYRAWTFSGLAASPYGRLNLYRFGLDMQLFTPDVNGWSLQFGFNPSINTDLEHQLTSDAWNFDGNIAARLQYDPIWTFVLGVQYWDRVDDIVLPTGGVIITPNDRWEFRLLFPKGRISYFLGNFWNGSHWLYVSSEYHVEAYQYNNVFTPRDRVQYEDWRFALGMRSDHGWFDKYIEVAWVTGRNFENQSGFPPKVNVDDQVMVRGGIRF